jgi:hypothetical protein
MVINKPLIMQPPPNLAISKLVFTKRKPPITFNVQEKDEEIRDAANNGDDDCKGN